MSIQDKIERIIKQIHVLFSEGPVISGEENKVIVDKTEIFPILEQLNLAIYEMMDQYEATAQARELAQRRTEKEGKELVERISQQTEDIYAASLIYTDDALNQVQKLMENALAKSRSIWEGFIEDLEKEKRRVKEDQMELTEQLRDFKDSRKYQIIIEERNREREKLEKEQEIAVAKKIKNEAKHYPLNITPEIKVNPAYFERHKQMFGKEVRMWTEEKEVNELKLLQDEAAGSAISEETASDKAVLGEAADILGAVLGKTSGALSKPEINEETGKNASETAKTEMPAALLPGAEQSGAVVPMPQFPEASRSNPAALSDSDENVLALSQNMQTGEDTRSLPWGIEAGENAMPLFQDSQGDKDAMNLSQNAEEDENISLMFQKDEANRNLPSMPGKEEGDSISPISQAEEAWGISPISQTGEEWGVSPISQTGEERGISPISQAGEDWDIPPMPQTEEDWDIPPMPKDAAEQAALEDDIGKPFVMPEVKVDLNAAYFKWRNKETEETKEEQSEEQPKKKFLFGRKSGTK